MARLDASRRSGATATSLGAATDVFESDDPIGDVQQSVWKTSASAPARPHVAAIDIARVAAWIADRTLHAEVTLAGSAPGPRSRYERVSLRVCHGEAVLDAPVCTDVPCDSWFDGPPKFAVTVTQWPGQWIVASSIELADIDSFAGTAPHADEYRVLAHSGAVEAGGVCEGDHAPDGPEAWLIVPGSSGLAGSPRAPVARVTLRGSPFFDRAADEADMRWGMGLTSRPTAW